MTFSSPVVLQPSLHETYLTAQSFHQPLAFAETAYETHVLALVIKDCTESSAAAMQDFLDGLYTTDLYLVAACLRADDAAWRRLSQLYQGCLYDAALSVCKDRAAAGEIAGAIFGHLFLPDRANQPRLASYNGQHALATWLRAIIVRQALNEQARKDNRCQRLEAAHGIADTAACQRLEATVLEHQCGAVLSAVLTAATHKLRERERLVLALRYADGVKVNEIAVILAVKPPTITYYLRQAEKHLHHYIVEALRQKYRMSEATISDYIAELLANPSYALVARLGETKTAAA